MFQWNRDENRDENNEILVVMEIESQQQKHDPKDSHCPLSDTEICLKTLRRKITGKWLTLVEEFIALDKNIKKMIEYLEIAAKN
jgi:hypothetical protein